MYFLSDHICKIQSDHMWNIFEPFEIYMKVYG